MGGLAGYEPILYHFFDRRIIIRKTLHEFLFVFVIFLKLHGCTVSNCQVVHWDKEKFVREQRSSFQPFLSSLIGADGVQYLERFIEERCRALNSGLPISDEFETEIANMDRLKMQAVNPEVIHQAVQSVKENASDVIGALKDRVTGIQVSFFQNHCVQGL
ncbi:hypothetical protein ANCCAN_15323 [Ancylostoma caninum]|uniref:dDENN domain-containing protein n=1 Tax=Ancylostoma caninum TaxID=29170 RepID=A0A368G2S7_ANCCA|nr:hypothetical protein ANCCAN_15323 [Ancylostoma caninum]